MLLQLLWCGREVEADVQLSVGGVHIEGREALQNIREGLKARCRATAGGRCWLGGQMSLQTDAFDAHAVRLDELDDAASASCFVAVELETVVVV